jgi:hypothetical protein
MLCQCLVLAMLGCLLDAPSSHSIHQNLQFAINNITALK